MMHALAIYLLALLVAIPFVTPLGEYAALADDTDPEYLRIIKTVDGLETKDLTPGGAFTWQVRVVCSEQSCVNAQLVDSLPAELEGFALTSVELSPSTVPSAITWYESDTPLAAQPTVIGAQTKVVVNIGNGVPMENGRTVNLNMTMQVPDTFTADDPRHGQRITNTAQASADNARTVRDDAAIRVTHAYTLGASTTKTWSPSTATYEVGRQSTVTLQAASTATVNVDHLHLNEPNVPLDPTTPAHLNADNPFRTHNFVGFAGATLPSGATGVKVDALTLQGGTWTWVEGATSATPALPVGVAPEDVGALRFQWSGPITASGGAQLQITLAQRGSDRNDPSADLSAQNVSIRNESQAWVTRRSEESARVQAMATHAVGASVIGTTIDKSLSKTHLVAGTSTTGTINAQNTGAPVQRWVISDSLFDATGAPATTLFFDEYVRFGGFSQAIAYPSGATSGKVIYHLLNGGTEEVPFASASIPAAPSGAIKGFEVVFEGTGNSIPTGATTSLRYTITTDSSLGSGVTRTSSAHTTVTTSAGRSATNNDSATLATISPDMTITTVKTITPKWNIRPGRPLTVSISGTGAASSDYVKITKLVIEDSVDSGTATTFWNAANLAGISPTEVPEAASLVLSVRDASGTWHDLWTEAPQTRAWIFAKSLAELNAALPAGMTVDDVTGVRFAFERPQTRPFPASQTVIARANFVTRATLRGTTTPTDEVDGAPGSTTPQVATTYRNTAQTTAFGRTDGGDELSKRASATDSMSIRSNGSPNQSWPGTGHGDSIGVDKAWSRNEIPALSAESASTTLAWTVPVGRDRVRLTDPADPSTVAQTVFDAFNLRGLSAIPVHTTVDSNGWAIQWDIVESIELYENGAWTVLPAPGGSWQEANGGFKGLTLDASQQTNTTGLRITLVPNDARRASAIAAGTTNVPAVGSGVTSTSVPRTFSVSWYLRELRRSDGSAVSGNAIFNVAGEAGMVNNILELEAFRAANVETARAEAPIRIVNSPMAVSIDKNVATATQVVPDPGTDPRQLPTNTFTLTARNTSTSPATHVRVTDPTACSDTGLNLCRTDNTASAALANPFLGLPEIAAGTIDATPGAPNPFNRYDITRIAISVAHSSQVNISNSKVWLLRYDPTQSAANRYSFTETTVASVNAMTASQLADVVGISTTFVGRQSTYGTIKNNNDLKVVIETRLRPTLRDTGQTWLPTTEELRESKNRAYAQSYDPVLWGTDAYGADVDDAAVDFTRGGVDIAVGKSISDGTILQGDSAADQRQMVTLTAHQSTSTASPTKVVIEDRPDGTGVTDSNDFWKHFDLDALGTITAPAGADRIQIDAYNGTTWVTGTPVPIGSQVLPAGINTSNVQGLRFIFTRADGARFNVTTPNWEAFIQFTVALRQQQRGSTAAVVFPGTANNRMTGQSFVPNGESVLRTTEDNVEWSSGVAHLQIDKWANNGLRTVAVGDFVPWDITIRNNGTSLLNLLNVTDTLPNTGFLKYTGDNGQGGSGIVFTPGVLGDGVTPGSLTQAPTVDATDPQRVVLTWAQGANTLRPGETAKIRIYLEVQPGVRFDEYIINTVTAKTVQSLVTVTDAIPNNGAEQVRKVDDNTGQAQDQVKVAMGTNVYVVKGVMGSLGTAKNMLDSTQTCTPILQGPGGAGDTYFRTPCVSDSTQLGSDKWVLHIVNAGSTDLTYLEIFDQLPTADDKFLVSGTWRGSQYRPVPTGAFTISGLPDGVTAQQQVTTSPRVCEGSWPNLPQSAPCEQAGETWTPVTASTDWSTVTGWRVNLDFTTSAAGAFKPGAVLDVTYTTTNAYTQAAGDALLSKDIPIADNQAWNQFGMTYLDDLGIDSVIAPNRVGVHLRSGSLEVTKRVTGAAAAVAPATFTATLTCTHGTNALTFDGGNTSKQITLTANTPVRIPGIPVGAVCTVTEDGAVGSFGEDSRLGSPTSITVATADSGTTTALSPVPDAHKVTLTNEYLYGGLSVTKRVDSNAIAGNYGPFTFSLACTSAGQPVLIDGQTTTTFSLNDGQTWTAPGNQIPTGSVCVLKETDTGGASNTVFAGNGTANSDGSFSITIPRGSAEVVATTVTNAYASGTFTVKKVVTGEGAATYGAADFGFTTACTHRGSEIFTQTFRLAADASRTFGPFPVGTRCVTSEVDTGHATSSTLAPADGIITIREATQGTVEVTATNQYDVGELVIHKERLGAGATVHGVGPFIAQATCTRTVGVVPVPIALPDQGRIVLNAANNYTARIGGILKGATCVVEEIDAAGATSTPQLRPTDGRVTISGSGAQAVSVVISNTFQAGVLRVEKAVSGQGAQLYGSGPFSFRTECVIPDGLGAAGQGGTKVETFTLAAGAYKELGPYPVGTECTVRETLNGGATTSVLEPADGTVTIEADDDDAEELTVATVKATNTFDIGHLVIVKKRIGAGKDHFGKGPFVAQVTCSRVIDEATVEFALPHNGVVTLSQANDYTVRLDNLPVGTQCTVIETDRGGASRTTMDPADGKVTIAGGVTGAVDMTVTITNEFPTPPPKRIAKTGSTSMALLSGAGVVLLAGAVALMVKRRGSRKD